MYRYLCREFFCGYWGLKGSITDFLLDFLDFVVYQNSTKLNSLIFHTIHINLRCK